MMTLRITKTLAAVLVAPLCAVGLAACGSDDTASTGKDNAGGGSAKPLKVAVSLYPLAYVASAVGGPHVSITNLVPAGGDPHDVELTPKDVGKLTDDDLLLYLSGPTQPSVVQAAQGDAKNIAFDVAPSAKLELTVGKQMELAHSGEHKDEHGHAGEHKDEHGHADEHAGEHKDDHEHAGEHKDDHGHEAAPAATSSAPNAPGAPAPAASSAAATPGGEHEHEHDMPEGSVDPHFWLDPVRMQSVIDAVAGKMSELRPDQKDAFTANATKAKADLAALDQQMAAGLKNCPNTKLVTAHAAFGYLADRYKLTQVGIAGLSPEDEPSPAALAALGTYVRDNKVPTIYYESQASNAVARTLAQETGVKTAVLHTMEAEGDTADSYRAAMTENLNAIQKGQGCS